jgi:hypothetical protein
MPKNGKMGKHQGAKVAPVQTDDDFHGTLAQVCAADLAIMAVTSISNPTTAAANTTTSSSSSSTPRVPGTPPSSPAVPQTEEMISDAAMFDACKRGDTAQLWR